MSPLSSESGLLTVFPFSITNTSLEINCTFEFPSSFLPLLDILKLWKQVEKKKGHSKDQMCILRRKLEFIFGEGPFVSGETGDFFSHVDVR